MRQAIGVAVSYDPGMSNSTALRADTTMLTFNGCPRCRGTVLDYTARADKDALCVICGWRRPNIPPDVPAYVDEHPWKPRLRERYERTTIGTGKPPLGGWERLKRLRHPKTA
jgi:hypothetical protein